MSGESRTIPEIKAQYDQEDAERLSRWQAKINEVASRQKPEAGEYFDYMSNQGRSYLLREQMEADLGREREGL